MNALHLRMSLALVLFLLLNGVSETRAEGPAGGLAAFPRPRQDNGWGIHWAPTLFGQTRDIVDYFVGESKSMGIKWVKFLNGDSSKVDHEYLVRQLVANGMMPVMRVYKPFNDPYENLDALVRSAVPMGLTYIELYNEPNIAGSAGGWRDGEAMSITRLVDLWIPAAETVIRAGGYPGLPSLAPGGDYDDNQFLRELLDGIKARGKQDVLRRAWLPLHNYFLNHPVDYPEDEVNLKSPLMTVAEIARRQLTPGKVASINQARQISRLPRSRGGYYVADTIDGDSNAFRKFEAYEHIFYQRFGYAIPIISTEGGAVAGAGEDPRYPVVTDDDVAQETLYAFRYMVERAPSYYFAFTPWMIAGEAGAHRDLRFEAQAWYRDREGDTLPVVNVLKQNARRPQTRRYTPENSPDTVDLPPSVKPLPTPGPAATPTPASRLPAAPVALGDESYIVHATESISMRWLRADDGVDVALNSRTTAPVRIVMWQNRVPATSQTVDLAAGEVVTIHVNLTGTIGVQVFDATDRLLLDYGALSGVPPPARRTAATSAPVSASGAYTVTWDKRLDELQVQLKQPAVAKGQHTWRATKVEYLDTEESRGLHHIYVETLDERGERVLGQAVWVTWPGGQSRIVTEDKAAPEYAANFPMYGPVGSYQVKVDGSSDVVDGLGMESGGRAHVSFKIVFQRMVGR
ncbi:MAG: hypothetical protein HZB53_13830 [Chloroflexi bacterium]|nr:hypothetical protein [Chloroflexota bacterium]